MRPKVIEIFLDSLFFDKFCLLSKDLTYSAPSKNQKNDQEGDGFMDDIICIYNTFESTEADLIKAQLESRKIPCFLRTDNAGGVLPHLNRANGIGIMVRKEDKEQATKIIEVRLASND